MEGLGGLLGLRQGLAEHAAAGVDGQGDRQRRRRLGQGIDHQLPLISAVLEDPHIIGGQAA